MPYHSMLIGVTVALRPQGGLRGFNLIFGSEDVFSLVIPMALQKGIGTISCDRRLENVKSRAG